MSNVEPQILNNEIKKLANASGGMRSKLLLLINICLNIYCGDNVTKLSPVPAAHWTAPVNNRWAPLSELLPL